MSDKKQTAVDWLVYVVQCCIPPDYIPIEIVKQAKQMEKDQIIEAHKQGNKNNGWALPHEHEQYYNETYNTNQ
jgi:hypothetical protein